MKRLLKFIFIMSLLTNVVLTLGLVYFHTKKAFSNAISKSRYSFLSPRIFVEDQNDILINFTQLRKRLNEYYDEINLNHSIQYSMYFEYLPTGVSIGINDQIGYVPTSLLKTPMAMGIFNEIAKGQIQRDELITLTPEMIDKGFGNLWRKGVGTSLTVDEALKIMLQDSDNTAQKALFSVMHGLEVEEVFDALDIPRERTEDEVTVTTKNYSSILRSLYLSSFLPLEYSNEMLSILTKTSFHDKIPAGVPSTIKVAHKIGVYSKDLDSKYTTYSDCGIVYVPKRPYILCVMIESDESKATVITKTISKMVYDYVSHQ